jgi:beta-phosphoglucomutase-like phosphatase (HAD superfamily)
MKRIDIVFVFDFDGVIVDTLKPLYAVYLKFLEEFGVIGTKKEFDSLNGPTVPEIVAFLKNKYELENDIEELLRRYCRKLSSAYEKCGLNDGAEEIVKLLKHREFIVALASSSKKTEIAKILNRFELRNHFDFIITGEDVARAKPSPEIYNVVKDKYPSHEYYVVEDSENGLQAAIEAKMKTVFYNPENKCIEKDVTYEINSLQEVGNIVTEIDLNCFTISKAKEIKLGIVEYEPNINCSQKKAIEIVWKAESRQRKLSDEKMVSYRSHKKTGDRLNIECFMTQYKYFLAELREPGIDLGIRPIGVSGVIIDSDRNTVLGVRRNVTEYEGFYEFIPSGSIDPSKRSDDSVLIEEQIIQELEEEAYLKKDSIDRLEPYCLIFDRSHGVYDICCRVYTKGPVAELIKEKESSEYFGMEIVRLKEIETRIEMNRCVPSSIVMFNNLDWEV